MINIDELKFGKDGLIPAVVVDSVTKKVLTVAYMNRESLEISMRERMRSVAVIWYGRMTRRSFSEVNTQKRVRMSKK